MAPSCQEIGSIHSDSRKGHRYHKSGNVFQEIYIRNRAAPSCQEIGSIDSDDRKALKVTDLYCNIPRNKDQIKKIGNGRAPSCQEKLFLYSRDCIAGNFIS